MATKKHAKLAGYPQPGYNGHTDDAVRCPNCGSQHIRLLDGFTSGQRLGICFNCGENYVVEPIRPTPVAPDTASRPAGDVDDEDRGAGEHDA